MQGRPPIRILVVDDDVALTTLIDKFLTKNQFIVFAANDPREALKIVEKEDIRLVITDLMMPHIHGIELTQRIHALPGKKDLPVIVMTAYGSDDVNDKGMRKGVAMTLSKPVQLAKLLDIVGFATQ